MADHQTGDVFKSEDISFLTSRRPIACSYPLFRPSFSLSQNTVCYPNCMSTSHSALQSKPVRVCHRVREQQYTLPLRVDKTRNFFYVYPHIMQHLIRPSSTHKFTSLHRLLPVAYRGGVSTPPPPEISKALQNRAKLNPIVKTVKNC